MRSPIPMFQLFAVYLAFIYIVGPLYMRNRKAYSLNAATRLYNIFQIISCVYIVSALFKKGFKFEGAFDCSINVDNKTEIDLLSVWHYIGFTRVVELIETVFFILRHKQNQVTYLHVYHHLGSVFGAFMCLKYDASHRWIIHALINCTIHFFMYTYYLLSSYESMKKYTDRVKSSITIVQIIQLVFICIHSTFHTFATCGSLLFVTQALNTALLTVLFVNFFVQTYIKKKKKTN